MRNLRELDIHRINSSMWYGDSGDGWNGAFRFNVENGVLFVIASHGGGWDHVSVSREDRIPTWGEMEHIKRLFFLDTETAMQLHVPVSQHINCHPYCLHLWRPQNQEIPLPPSFMVGPTLENDK